MANVRISQLPSAPTAINGTELLPIVQNGLTCQTSIAAAFQVANNVTSFSAGSTGFTPATPTVGAVVLAGTLNIGHGGTGITTTPTNGQLLIGNGTGYTVANLTAGSGISVTNSSGGITISVDGSGEVTSFRTTLSGLTPSTATGGAITLAGTLGTASGGTNLTSFTSGGALYATSTSVLTTGTLPVGSGGTGLTSLTAGYIPYGNGTSALASSSTFNFSGTLLTSPAIALTASALTSSNTSNLNIGGTLSFSDTGIIASSVGTTNSYLQQVIQNKSNGTAASAEFIVYNDAGTASTNFATAGINSSTYTGTGAINAPGYGYFLTGSTDLVLGTIASNNIHFVTNTNATDAITINTSNAVAFNGLYGTSGQVLLSGSSTGAPTWTSQSSLAVGTATNLAGGAIGYIPYQSAANTTLFVTGNTTTTPQFLTSTGTGSAAQAPTLTGSTGSGNVVLATSPTFITSITAPLHLGGTTATSTLTLQSTSATGTTDSILFKVGNNGSLTPLAINDNSGTPNVTVASSTLFLGDFSNATLNSRTIFSTSTTNGTTGIYAAPNGTSTAASWQATNNASLTNASKILIATNGTTDVQLVSGINGSGTYLPLSFYNGGVQLMQLGTTATTANFAIGLNTAPNTSVNLLVSGSIAGSTNAWGQLNSGTIASTVTTLAGAYESTVAASAASFTLATLAHFYANPAAGGASSTVTSQMGFFAESTIGTQGGATLTNAYGFYSNVASGTNRYGFYNAGNAANNLGTGTTTIGAISATSRSSGSVLSTNAGQTSVQTLTLSGTTQQATVNMAGQTLATGQTYRVRAYGTLAAISSANVRQVQFSCYWGSTQLTALTSSNVLASTAQTTNWQLEFTLTASSATAIWTTGQLINRYASATAIAIDAVTPASVTGLTSASTLYLQVISSGTATSDVLNIQSVIMERLV